MKVWIAVVAVLLLVALVFRERFTTYEAALRSVGQTPGYTTSPASTPPASSSPTTPAAATTSPAATSVPSTAATVGGGTSGNLIGPTSGGVGKTGKRVWGPLFVGIGQSRPEGGDSTKSNTYPNLLGGMMGKQSSRIDGVGIVSPSQPGFDLGALPSMSSLGTEANARFLPFSRPESDGDPYRLAKGYSTKNYSPENEPVPFLTDFSAFFK